jgi:MFS family permease
MAVGGFVYSPYELWTNTYLQRAAPSQLMGRLFGAYMAVAGLGFPLGALMGAAIAPSLGLRSMLLMSGMASVALGAVAALTPAMRRLPDLRLTSDPAGATVDTSSAP